MDKEVSCSAIGYNLNSETCIRYFLQFIGKSYRSKTSSSDQLQILHFYAKCVKQVFITSPAGYNPKYESLHIILSRWLKQEIKYTRKSSQDNHSLSGITAALQEFPGKQKTSMSVSQLACFVKNLIDTGLIVTNNKEETLRFFSNHFSTQNTENISIFSLRSKFFKPDNSSISTTRENILKLLNSIQKN
ncbi:hypothetical protein DMA11_18045 [Marinilabiliaceae bacterium JC017]|nr:hypothetical protein DMA11_18045 [Marinilabiliaceae bacterium JC017]